MRRFRSRRDARSESARASLLALAHAANPTGKPERWVEGDRTAALILHDALLEAHDIRLPGGITHAASMYPVYDPRTKRYYGTLANTYANRIRLAMQSLSDGRHITIWFAPTKLIAGKNPLLERWRAPSRLPAGAVIVFDTSLTEKGQRFDAYHRARWEEAQREAEYRARHPPPPPRPRTIDAGPSFSLGPTLSLKLLPRRDRR